MTLKKSRLKLVRRGGGVLRMGEREQPMVETIDLIDSKLNDLFDLNLIDLNLFDHLIDHSIDHLIDAKVRPSLLLPSPLLLPATFFATLSPMVQ